MLPHSLKASLGISYPSDHQNIAKVILLQRFCTCSAVTITLRKNVVDFRVKISPVVTHFCCCGFH